MYLFKRIQWLVYLCMHQCPIFFLFGSTKAQVLNLLLPEHLADWRRTCEPPMHRYYKGLSSLYPLRSLSDPLRSLEHWGPLRTLLVLSGHLRSSQVACRSSQDTRLQMFWLTPLFVLLPSLASAVGIWRIRKTPFTALIPHSPWLLHRAVFPSHPN